MTNMIDWAAGLTRVLVSENERVLALHKGRFIGILGPGEYRLPNRDGTLVAERHDLNSPAFVSKFERALMRERPDLAARHLTVLAAEEGEVAVLMREAMLDTQMRGFDIPRGSKVAFGVASANRDETLYQDPHGFRLDRPQPKAHFGFGGGPHVCPGAALARLEGRVLLDVLVDKVDRIAVPDDFVRQPVPVFWANGPAALPFELHA